MAYAHLRRRMQRMVCRRIAEYPYSQPAQSSVPTSQLRNATSSRSQLATLSGWVRASCYVAAMHDGAVTYRLAVCATRRAFAARPSVAVLAIEAPPRLLSFSTEPPRETCLLALVE